MKNPRFVLLALFLLSDGPKFQVEALQVSASLIFR